jgi:hypothetical protein
MQGIRRDTGCKGLQTREHVVLHLKTEHQASISCVYERRENVYQISTLLIAGRKVRCNRNVQETSRTQRSSDAQHEVYKSLCSMARRINMKAGVGRKKTAHGARWAVAGARNVLFAVVSRGLGLHAS